MPAFTNAIPAEANDDSRTLLDVWDLGPSASMRQPFGGGLGGPANGRLVRFGGVNATEVSNGRNFYTFDPNQNSRMPDASQRVGTTQARAVLSGGPATVPWLNWLAAFDPADYTGLGAAMPLHYQITMETTIRRVLGGSTAGYIVYGWGNSGGSTGDPFSASSIGGLGMGLYSPGSSNDWEGIFTHADPANLGATSVTPLIGGPVSALDFHRLKLEVITGPVFTMSYHIDGVLVGAFDTAAIGWTNLDNCSAFDEFTMRGYFDVSSSGAGVEGPYLSRGRIMVVS